MTQLHTLPPLSLYIHLPWCVQKCPYCDFNSHALKDNLPEALYVTKLMQELEAYLPLVQNRSLISIFFGGGTPSLFSGKAIARILEGAAKRISFGSPIEITLEANPGTVDQVHFAAYREAGVNRLSLGIQSFQNDKLKTLGRIHDRDHALKAIEIARLSGFDNFNLDIMYGLPAQSIDDALHDLSTALSCKPTHFSWYQLTLEPNTLFYHQPPPLPPDDLLYDMQLAGLAQINAAGFNQYEVSAYSLPEKNCLHNRNYWEFGDYLGIGAGAHSKISTPDSIFRFAQVKHPRDYLNLLDPAPSRGMTAVNIDPMLSFRGLSAGSSNATALKPDDLTFEFMLNALRLTDGIPLSLFIERTRLPLSKIQSQLNTALKRGLIENNTEQLVPTELGKRFLNDLVSLFLPAEINRLNATRFQE